MKTSIIGRKVNVARTIPGQFYQKGVGVLTSIENGIASIELTTGRGVFGQFHRSTNKAVNVLARTIHISPLGEGDHAGV